MRNTPYPNGPASTCPSSRRTPLTPRGCTDAHCQRRQLDAAGRACRVDHDEVLIAPTVDQRIAGEQNLGTGVSAQL
jgi:hypothetical protein